MISDLQFKRVQFLKLIKKFEKDCHGHCEAMDLAAQELKYPNRHFALKDFERIGICEDGSNPQLMMPDWWPSFISRAKVGEDGVILDQLPMPDWWQAITGKAGILEGDVILVDGKVGSGKTALCAEIIRATHRLENDFISVSGYEIYSMFLTR